MIEMDRYDRQIKLEGDGDNDNYEQEDDENDDDSEEVANVDDDEEAEDTDGYDVSPENVGDYEELDSAELMLSNGNISISQ